MLALKVELQLAEKARQYLLKEGLYAKGFKPQKDAEYIYFPILGKKKGFPFRAKIVKMQFEPPEDSKDWRQILIERNILNQNELSLLPRAYDSVGDILVIEIPAELKRREKAIADVLLETHPQFKVIANKISAVKGEFRVRGLKMVGGENRLVTLYRENGCEFKIDLGKIYFSPRLSYERERIGKLVRKNETFLALFAGAGFFPIVAAKFQPNCKIIAIELNPHAIKFMRENARINKMSDKIEVIEGDVKKILKGPRYKRWASRIIMPLPHSAHEFLPAAISAAKKDGTIHFYHIPKTPGDAFESALSKIRAACEKSRRKCKIVFKRVVKTYAPRVDEVVIDFKLLN